VVTLIGRALGFLASLVGFLGAVVPLVKESEEPYLARFAYMAGELRFEWMAMVVFGSAVVLASYLGSDRVRGLLGLPFPLRDAASSWRRLAGATICCLLLVSGLSVAAYTTYEAVRARASYYKHYLGVSYEKALITAALNAEDDGDLREAARSFERVLLMYPRTGARAHVEAHLSGLREEIQHAEMLVRRAQAEEDRKEKVSALTLWTEASRMLPVDGTIGERVLFVAEGVQRTAEECGKPVREACSDPLRKSAPLSAECAMVLLDRFTRTEASSAGRKASEPSIACELVRAGAVEARVVGAVRVARESQSRRTEREAADPTEYGSR
jgi:hypothetical protein